MVELTTWEYEFLTDPTGDLEMYDLCKKYGWITGFNKYGSVNLTPLGEHEIKKYEEGTEEA